MPHRLTCPHCGRALLIPESVTVAVMTCPRCLGRIPNPAVADAGAPDVLGSRRVLAIDAEVTRDTRRLGWGVILLAILLTLGLAFFASLAMTVSDQEGYYGENLLLIWFGVGGLGGLTVLVLATIAMSQHFFRRMPETAETSRGERRVLQGLAVFGALCIGLLAAVAVIGLTCGAVLGGGMMGGM